MCDTVTLCDTVCVCRYLSRKWSILNPLDWQPTIRCQIKIAEEEFSAIFADGSRAEAIARIVEMIWKCCAYFSDCQMEIFLSDGDDCQMDSDGDFFCQMEMILDCQTAALHIGHRGKVTPCSSNIEISLIWRLAAEISWKLRKWKEYTQLKLNV